MIGLSGRPPRMKLVIQIPAFNEEATISRALAALPRSVPGFAAVEILVVDDGSTDRTAEIAKAGGATRVLRSPINRGLAEAFSRGVREASAMGADVIVAQPGTLTGSIGVFGGKAVLTGLLDRSGCPPTRSRPAQGCPRSCAPPRAHSMPA